MPNVAVIKAIFGTYLSIKRDKKELKDTKKKVCLDFITQAEKLKQDAEWIEYARNLAEKMPKEYAEETGYIGMFIPNFIYKRQYFLYRTLHAVLSYVVAELEKKAAWDEKAKLILNKDFDPKAHESFYQDHIKGLDSTLVDTKFSELLDLLQSNKVKNLNFDSLFAPEATDVVPEAKDIVPEPKKEDANAANNEKDPADVKPASANESVSEVDAVPVESVSSVPTSITTLIEPTLKVALSANESPVNKSEASTSPPLSPSARQMLSELSEPISLASLKQESKSDEERLTSAEPPKEVKEEICNDSFDGQPKMPTNKPKKWGTKTFSAVTQSQVAMEVILNPPSMIVTRSKLAETRNKLPPITSLRTNSTFTPKNKKLGRQAQVLGRNAPAR